MLSGSATIFWTHALVARWCFYLQLVSRGYRVLLGKIGGNPHVDEIWIGSGLGYRMESPEAVLFDAEHAQGVVVIRVFAAAHGNIQGDTRFCIRYTVNVRCFSACGRGCYPCLRHAVVLYEPVCGFRHRAGQNDRRNHQCDHYEEHEAYHYGETFVAANDRRGEI